MDVWDSAGPYLTEHGAMAALDSDSVALRALVRAGRLLVVTTVEGETLYPAWQFQETHLTQVRAVGPLFAHARVAPEAVVDWWVTPAEALSGLSPRGWVDRGGDAKVVHDLAEAAAARWASD